MHKTDSSLESLKKYKRGIETELKTVRFRIKEFESKTKKSNFFHTINLVIAKILN
jgi:hypothetical protein